jgi:hypothetical protein
MRDSRSLDFEDGASGAGVIHAMAGSPSVGMPGTPGMLTPKEISGTGGVEEKGNPFEEFNSVTRDVGDF